MRARRHDSTDGRPRSRFRDGHEGGRRMRGTSEVRIAAPRAHVRRADKWRSATRAPAAPDEIAGSRAAPASNLLAAIARAHPEMTRAGSDLENREARNRHAAFQPCVSINVYREKGMVA